MGWICLDRFSSTARRKCRRLVFTVRMEGPHHKIVEFWEPGSFSLISGVRQIFAIAKLCWAMPEVKAQESQKHPKTVEEKDQTGSVTWAWFNLEAEHILRCLRVSNLACLIWRSAPLSMLPYAPRAMQQWKNLRWAQRFKQLGSCASIHL